MDCFARNIPHDSSHASFFCQISAFGVRNRVMRVLNNLPEDPVMFYWSRGCRGLLLRQYQATGDYLGCHNPEETKNDQPGFLFHVSPFLKEWM